MVCVPAGEFIMGSSDADPDAQDDEKPQHTVTLDAFWIDRTEVTNDRYRQCVAAGACVAPEPCDWAELTYLDGNKGAYPVECVDWNAADAYCRWAGAHLPTEAQWEKAARGIDGRHFPWGNDFDGSKANYCDRNCGYDWKDTGGDDGHFWVAPVGSFPSGASPYGALDMAGNAWEWTADYYDAGYYAASPDRNPTGPDEGYRKTLRGGASGHPAARIRTTDRFYYGIKEKGSSWGFRCALLAQP
jgi:formylglycine-generating enzyme required for sulfatase activity